MLSTLSLIQVPDFALPVAGGVLAALAVGLGLLFLFVSRYKRCPANKVLVISGSVGGGNAAKCISGGGKFVWPVLQEYDYLSLEPIQIDIPLKDALSFENIRVSVPSVFTVAIGNDEAVRQNAAIRLLKLDQAQIKRQAQDIIFGQLRQVIASMRIEEINRDRESFLHNIQTSLEPELKKVGLVLLNVNITDINDESGYIEAIGRKAAAEAVQKARGDVADQEKMGEVRVAEAERERTIQVANATKLREIGTREAQREQAVRLAELDKEQKVGEELAALEREAQVKEAQRQQAVRIAELDKEQRVGEQTAAFERDAQVKEAEQRKRVAIATAEAKAIAGEAQSQAQIVGTRAQLQVREAEAYELSEKRKREAEAAVLEAQNRALAKAALAEAERVEAERRAALEAPAKAEKARTIVEAEAEAERRRLHAQAEAAATFAQLEAEARGQYEILAKKAEGLKQIVDACGGSQQAFQLLMLEHLDNLAETAATAISNVKFDKVVVWDGGSGAGTGNFLQGMARSLPPMMEVVKEIGGVELPALFGKLAEGADAAPATVPVPKIVSDREPVPQAPGAPAEPAG
ncbi:MAG TPA: SPFH domain-containing protein [Longimicrobiaceae bacterium]|nr:SPFH domain-containing protein [Longimicrobiaceae bacterium]